MPEVERPFVHSLQNLANEVYPPSHTLPYVDHDAAHVLRGLEHVEKHETRVLPNGEKARYLADALTKGPRVDNTSAVETAARMVVDYKFFQSWDEKDVRLFFATTLAQSLGHIQQTLFEFDAEEKIHKALFSSTQQRISSVAYDLQCERQTQYSSLLERVLERAGDPPADLRQNK